MKIMLLGRKIKSVFVLVPFIVIGLVSLFSPNSVYSAGYGDSCGSDNDCVGCLTCDADYTSWPVLLYCNTGDWHGNCAAAGKTCGTDGLCHGPAATSTPTSCLGETQICGYTGARPCCSPLTCQSTISGVDKCKVPPPTPQPTPSCFSQDQVCNRAGDGRSCCSGLTCQSTISGVDKCKVPSGAPTLTPTPPPGCKTIGATCYGTECCSGLTCGNWEQGAGSCITAPTSTPGGPTPTPTTGGGGPTPTPTRTPQVCAPSFACVSNTLPDTVFPGQTFTAEVKVKNPSYCYWGKGSNFLGAIPTCSTRENCRWGFPRADWSDVNGDVNATIANVNDVVKFDLHLIAPSSPGVYDSYWQMVFGSTPHSGSPCGKQITVLQGNKMGTPSCASSNPFRLITFSASPAPTASSQGHVVRVLSQPAATADPTIANFGPENCNGNNTLPSAAKYLYCGTTLNSVRWTFASAGEKKIWAVFHNDVNGTGGWSAPVSIPITYKPHDIVEDGAINETDYNKLKACYSPLGSASGDCVRADLNCDNVVNALDYSLFMKGWEGR